jgi:hypothetical protein
MAKLCPVPGAGTQTKIQDQPYAKARVLGVCRQQHRRCKPRSFEQRFFAMADDKPLSDNDADDRLKATLEVLGTAPGRTVVADTALQTARRALSIISWSLVTASVRREASSEGAGRPDA